MENVQPDTPAEPAAPHQIFDRVFKRLMRISEAAIIRFINALFHKNYPPDSTVEYLATENINDRLSQTISDAVFLINHVDKYIIEAQMADDENMALRIFTYSYGEGLKGRRNEGNKIKIRLVPALVIYLDPALEAPPELCLEVVDMDGLVHEFKFPAMRMFDYTVADLERRDLSPLLPFYLLKMRKKVRNAQAGEKRRELSREMKNLLEELVGAVERSEREGRMSMPDLKTVLGLAGVIYDHLYKQYQEFEETTMELDEMILTRFDKIEIEAKARGREEGQKEGVLKILDLLAQGKTVEEAKKILGVE